MLNGVVVVSFEGLLAALREGAEFVMGIPKEGFLCDELEAQQEAELRETIKKSKTKILTFRISESVAKQLEDLIGNAKSISGFLNASQLTYLPPEMFTERRAAYFPIYQDALREERRKHLAV